MFFLPNDVLNKIVDQLDIVGLIRLNATCKGMRENVGLNMKVSKHPVQYLNKIDNRSYKYHNLTEMVDDILREIQYSSDSSVSSASLFKEYTTNQQQQNFTLHVNRRTKSNRFKPTHYYGFSIKKKGSRCSSFELTYDSASDCYVCMRQIGVDVHLPLLFLYLGCKLVFRMHGSREIKCFREFPSWFQKILLCDEYNGMLLKDIVTGYIVV